MNNSVFCSLQSSDVSTVSSSSLDTRYTTEHETLTIGKDVFVDDTTQYTGRCSIQRLKIYSFDEIWNVHKNYIEQFRNRFWMSVEVIIWLVR